MGALVQTKAARIESFKQLVSPPQARPLPIRVVPALEQRTFPVASTQPILPAMIRDDMIEFYAFIFCQGGFRELGMTFEQFLLVAAALRPADLPATRDEARIDR
jgi:hypothetical protein